MKDCTCEAEDQVPGPWHDEGCPRLLRCLDAGPDCDGPVELRLNPRTWNSWPRCDVHWRKWLDAIDGVNQRYPDQANPPAGFDAAAAGESWDEEE